jgi:hypothetical protein
MSATSSPPLIKTFSTGNEIIVVGSSKHHGRTATIKRVRKRRQTVKFHDKQRGTYVDCDNACIIDYTPTIIANTATVIKDKEINNISAVLEQLTITTATAIKLHQPEEPNQQLHTFTQSLNKHLGMVQQDKI